MKFILLLLFISVFSICNSLAQKMYSVNYDYQADIKVYVVNYNYQADLLVYKVKYDYQAKENKGLWFFTDSDYQADLKIYFVDYDYQTKWRNETFMN